MTSIPKTPNRAAIAEEFLTLADAQYQEHYLHRPYYAAIASEHGLTNQRIADIYGVTEGAVRAMIKRHEAASGQGANK